MVELKRSPILHLLQSTSSWTDKGRLNAAVTAVLMADTDVQTCNVAFEGLRAGRYHVDGKLIADLYAVCPRPVRKHLVASSAFGYLEPDIFERRFFETFHSRGLTVLERRDLTDGLRTFLWRHPERLDRFTPLILGLLHSSEVEYQNRGLMLARSLSTLLERDRQLVKRLLRARSFVIRMSSFNLLFWWVKRKSELSPDLRAFCLSPEVREIAYDRYKHDPDVNVQTCAYYFLKAREPRAGHKPPKGMPVPPPRRKRRKRA